MDGCRDDVIISAENAAVAIATTYLAAQNLAARRGSWPPMSSAMSSMRARVSSVRPAIKE